MTSGWPSDVPFVSVAVAAVIRPARGESKSSDDAEIYAKAISIALRDAHLRTSHVASYSSTERDATRMRQTAAFHSSLILMYSFFVFCFFIVGLTRANGCSRTRVASYLLRLESSSRNLCQPVLRGAAKRAGWYLV